MFQNLKFKKIDIIIAPIVLIFFLIIGATYNYYFKQKNFTLVKILYDISAYDRPETFYMNGKTHMNMFIKSFENPYFGNRGMQIWQVGKSKFCEIQNLGTWYYGHVEFQKLNGTYQNQTPCRPKCWQGLDYPEKDLPGPFGAIPGHFPHGPEKKLMQNT